MSCWIFHLLNHSYGGSKRLHLEVVKHVVIQEIPTYFTITHSSRPTSTTRACDPSSQTIASRRPYNPPSILSPRTLRNFSRRRSPTPRYRPPELRRRTLCLAPQSVDLERIPNGRSSPCASGPFSWRRGKIAGIDGGGFGGRLWLGLRC